MKIDLLGMVEAGGCSAKIPPKQLEEILRMIPVPEDPDILVGTETHDDAGVYRISNDLAMVVTTDFFPPVCSDPYEFGQIAAANAISDVYAMGGTPVIALNIVMFPAARLPIEVYSDILRGGSDKAAEAGVKIIGGHTIDDFPPKYGLAVVGYVHPEKIITNAGARPGDTLILTKPLGMGIILAGQRLGLTDHDEVSEVKKYMMLLNKNGAEIMKKHGILCATDITGFGLAGHVLKMAKASGVSLHLNMALVPLIGNAYRLADQGCLPGVSFRNLEFADPDTQFANGLDYNLKMIAFDAQTSGGLLMCVPENKTESVLSDLHKAGLPDSAVIGNVSEKVDKYLMISN